MIPDHQTRFIRKISAALKKTKDTESDSATLFHCQPAEKIDRLLHAVQHRSDADQEALMKSLHQSARPINLNIVTCKDARAAAARIHRLALEKKPEWDNQRQIIAWHHPLIKALHLPEAFAGDEISLFFTDPATADLATMRRQAIDAYIGITSADFCMADTATLVMKTRPGHMRSVSLLPSIHIAVIRQEQIIADMKELFTLLQWDEKEKREGLTNCMTFISGPSKTADIEATMVHGAHGPREVYLYLITGKNPSRSGREKS